MSGVTHFERRGGGRKKEHPRCPFCSLEWRCTPKTIVKAGGPSAYLDLFHQHLTDHLAGTLTDERVGYALGAMRGFAPMVWNNC